MDRFAEFDEKIKKSLNTMDAKFNFLHDGIAGLKVAFRDFNEEITDFMAITAENYADHEKRITAIEKNIK